MKKKLGTAIEESLIQDAKVLAAEQGRPLQRIIEDALEAYVKQQRRLKEPSAVDRTWGAMPVDKKTLKRIMEMDNWFEV